MNPPPGVRWMRSRHSLYTHGARRGTCLPEVVEAMPAAGVIMTAPLSPAGVLGEEPSTPAVLKMTEDQLTALVVSLAKLRGFLCFHAQISQFSEKGWPDWTFARPGRLLFRELKGVRGRISPDQQKWVDTLRAAGADADFWWPTDWASGRIAAELAPDWARA